MTDTLRRRANPRRCCAQARRESMLVVHRWVQLRRKCSRRRGRREWTRLHHRLVLGNHLGRRPSKGRGLGGHLAPLLLLWCENEHATSSEISAVSLPWCHRVCWRVIAKGASPRGSVGRLVKVCDGRGVHWRNSRRKALLLRATSFALKGHTTLPLLLLGAAPLSKLLRVSWLQLEVFGGVSCVQRLWDRCVARSFRPGFLPGSRCDANGRVWKRAHGDISRAGRKGHERRRLRRHRRGLHRGEAEANSAEGLQGSRHGAAHHARVHPERRGDARNRGGEVTGHRWHVVPGGFRGRGQHVIIGLGVRGAHMRQIELREVLLAGQG
mmetsp:Transcript_1956/g.5996  ORF Transcript_1956/g.5996 Transcript_1956/m.5996 type:complete len:325 (+) Transcript_1956:414-1388(+)